MPGIDVPKESGRFVQNPGMGWYHPYYFHIEEPIDEFVMLPDLREEERLCLLEISLEAYRARDLDEAARQNLRGILEFFERNGKQVILRMCYDLEGRAKETEPSEISLVEAHIRQVADVVTGYEELIFLYQGLFIGNWGEMHSSPFATSANLGHLYQIFRESFGTEAVLAVRKWMYLGFLEREFGKDPYLTLFDDAMFADEGDMGTFLRREDEISKLWERSFRLGLPFGGEVLYNQMPHSIREVSRYPLSYLNSRYDVSAIELWKQEGCFDEISLRIGYRIVVKRIKRDGDGLVVVLENKGFGAVPFDLRLTFSGETDAKGEGASVCIPRGGLLEGQEMDLHIPCEGGFLAKGRLYLTTASGERVHFSNEGWEEGARIDFSEAGL